MSQALLASYWLPEAASKNAAAHDGLFYFILAVNIFFSSLIMAMLIYFVFKYRHKEGRAHDPTAGHSTALELTWTIIPTLLVLVIFYFGFRGYLHANSLPPNAYEVTANGAMWNWTFTYPNGHTNPELHLVVNRPTNLILQSADVIHDLDIPAFRMKKDAVPGRWNKEWFEPTKKGEYQIFCAMYCGTGHSIMLAKCVVEDQASFDKWMEKQVVWEPRMSFVQRGEELAKNLGCFQCHSINGTAMTGPTWKDLYGSQVDLTTGEKVLADDAYITESIIYPSKKIVAGFQDKMPQDFGSKLKPNDITALTWYIKKVSAGTYHGDMTEGTTVGAAAKYMKGGVAPTGASPAGGATTSPTFEPPAVKVQ